MEDWYAPDLSTASVRDYASKVEAGDFNADGRLDLAITNSEELAGNSPNKPHGISVFLQPDDLVDGTWQEVVVTQEHWSWHTLALDDFDFDGSLPQKWIARGKSTSASAMERTRRHPDVLRGPRASQR